jgi:hypothetical protein
MQPQINASRNPKLRSHRSCSTLHKPLDRLKIRLTIRMTFLIITVIGTLLPTAPARAQVDIQQIVTQKVQPILPKNGQGGEVAVGRPDE